MDWIKKHVDTVIVLGAIVSSMLWINTKFNQLEKDMPVMKAVLIIKNILPVELSNKEKNEQ